jgi:hypothetical protein
MSFQILQLKTLLDLKNKINMGQKIDDTEKLMNPKYINKLKEKVKTIKECNCLCQSFCGCECLK